MPTPERISLDLVFDVGAPGRWWRDGRLGRKLAEALIETGLWQGFRRYGRAGGRLTALRAPGDLEALSRHWQPAGYRLQREAGDDAGASSLSVNIREGYFDLTLVTAGDELASRRRTLFGSLAAFGRRVFGALSATSTLTLGQTMADEPWPRPRPPRIQTLCFTPGSLFDLHDLDYIREQGERRQAEAVARAPLPPGVTRTRDGRLVLIQWADDVGDLGAVNAARVAQERWLIAEVGLDRDPSYDEAGDLLEDAEGVEEHPPLTFYHPSSEVGYKAVVPSALDAAQWAELERWARRGRLPDASALGHLRLIVPRRELALELLPRARQAGLDAVLYTDNQGRWWNPAPPGPWLDHG